MLDGSRCQQVNERTPVAINMAILPTRWSSRDDFLFRDSPAKDIFIIFRIHFASAQIHSREWMEIDFRRNPSTYSKRRAPNLRECRYEKLFFEHKLLSQDGAGVFLARVWLLSPRKMSSRGGGGGRVRAKQIRDTPETNRIASSAPVRISLQLMVKLCGKMQ